MGVEFKDYDNDGRPDLIITALAGETFPVFRNEGKGSFVDATYGSKLGAATVKHSGWGLGLFDFNNDGWKDLFTANSHVNDRVESSNPPRTAKKTLSSKTKMEFSTKFPTRPESLR